MENSTKDRLAIIDLGSNTFHLLIVQKGEVRLFDVLYRERQFTGLAKSGLTRILDEKIDHGLKVLKGFKNKIDEFNVEKVRVIGTAALRSAQNSDDFVQKANCILGQDIEIIDGNREAELIFKGTHLVVDMRAGCFLIMDIGGGSVEFLLVENEKIIWAKSLNIGLGVLYSRFPFSDEVIREQRDAINDFLSSFLMTLRKKTSGKRISALIGSSGSFEVLEAMNGIPQKKYEASELSLKMYEETKEKILTASHQERLSMPGLPKERVDLIVHALLLIDFVIDLANPDKIIISPFALKEGLISEELGIRN